MSISDSDAGTVSGPVPASLSFTIVIIALSCCELSLSIVNGADLYEMIFQRRNHVEYRNIVQYNHIDIISYLRCLFTLFEQDSSVIVFSHVSVMIGEEFGLIFVDGGEIVVFDRVASSAITIVLFPEILK